MMNVLNIRSHYTVFQLANMKSLLNNTIGLLPQLLAPACGFGAYQLLYRSPLHPGPGVLVPEPPRQIAIEDPEPFTFRGYKITPLASFSLEARVLGTERYRMDRESDLAPVDLALGWGPMSDTRVLDQLNISQGGRFFFWSAAHLPLTRRQIVENAANMHMVPADEEVDSQLKSLRPGQVIVLRGYLIRAEASDGWRWVSSLSRTDTGRGACELVWVQALGLVEAPTLRTSTTQQTQDQGARG